MIWMVGVKDFIVSLFPDPARQEDWRRTRSLFAPPSWSRRTRGSDSTSRSRGSSTPSSWSRETFSNRKWQSTRLPSPDDLLFQHSTMQFSETLNSFNVQYRVSQYATPCIDFHPSHYHWMRCDNCDMDPYLLTSNTHSIIIWLHFMLIDFSKTYNKSRPNKIAINVSERALSIKFTLHNKNPLCYLS